VSLRARLIVGLLVLAAAGLVTLAAVTYAEQRSQLYDRVDQQAQSAEAPVSAKLDSVGANVGGTPDAQGGGPFFGASMPTTKYFDFTAIQLSGPSTSCFSPGSST